MEKQKERKLVDNIYGSISFTQQIWRYIDTPHFQRLRNIKQLGSLHYVFPSATHSRFQHCIGTAYLAKKYITYIIKNHPKLYPKEEDKYEAIFTVTLAGLLHDLGHGPYSHTFDNYIVKEITYKIEGEVKK